MKERKYIIEGIDILFVKSKRAKGINISIRPFKGVRVSVPSFVTYRSAIKIVHQRKDWINKNLEKIKNSEKKLTIFDFNSCFNTRNHVLKLIKVNSKELKHLIYNEEIIVYIPDSCFVRSELVQKEIRKAIEKAWQQEAKTILPYRIETLANKYGFKYQKLTIKNTKTRWGSCTFSNNINLSLHLIRLPDYLIDYVILHELVHTKVKNHSQEFWKMLQQISPLSKKHDKELKNYRIAIY